MHGKYEPFIQWTTSSRCRPLAIKKKKAHAKLLVLLILCAKSSFLAKLILCIFFNDFIIFLTYIRKGCRYPCTAGVTRFGCIARTTQLSRDQLSRPILAVCV